MNGLGGRSAQSLALSTTHAAFPLPGRGQVGRSIRGGSDTIVLDTRHCPQRSAARDDANIPMIPWGVHGCRDRNSSCVSATGAGDFSPTAARLPRWPVPAARRSDARTAASATYRPVDPGMGCWQARPPKPQRLPPAQPTVSAWPRSRKRGKKPPKTAAFADDDKSKNARSWCQSCQANLVGQLVRLLDSPINCFLQSVGTLA